MYVTSGRDAEVRLTIEGAVDLVNALRSGEHDTRALLHRHAFSRALAASDLEIQRLDTRFSELLDRFESIPDAPETETVEWVNAEIDRLLISPSMVVHEGAPLHIHWTPSTAGFDDQVIADVMMALAHELCDHGVRRFGRCAAADCEHLYYDATRNGSRRFCSDPRCASRTHTAEHRARRRSA
jgi:hypothetical protein